MGAHALRGRAGKGLFHAPVGSSANLLCFLEINPSFGAETSGETVTIMLREKGHRERTERQMSRAWRVTSAPRELPRPSAWVSWSVCEGPVPGAAVPIWKSLFSPADP